MKKRTDKKVVSTLMEDLLKDSPPFLVPARGTLVEGSVITIGRNRILVDLGGVTTGIIKGRETKDTNETIKSLKPGDQISASVVEEEDEEGFIVLSLRKASQEHAWLRFQKMFEQGTVFDVTPKEANKGGLLLEIDNVKAFIPVSQLAPLHYPRVNNADPNMILQRLVSLIGENFTVKILSIDKENGKLILSEKAALSEQRRSAMGQLKVGDKVTGVISGLVKFGMFVAFNGLEGLVHISEIAWGHVKDPAEFGKLGDKVDVQIIGLEGDKISLSMKRLHPDPWLKIAEKYPVGTKVKGAISRITQFGAFMDLENDVSGLIHNSELGNEPVKDAQSVVKVGDTVDAHVISVDLDEHRIGLSLKPEEKKSKKKKEETEEVPA